MLNNKDYDELAKEADNGLNGLGKIVKAIATLDQKSTQQQRNMLKWAKWSIVLTAIILIFTILAFLNISFNFKEERHIIHPNSHADNVEKPKVSNNEVGQNKTKSD